MQLGSWQLCAALESRLIQCGTPMYNLADIHGHEFINVLETRFAETAVECKWGIQQTRVKWCMTFKAGLYDSILLLWDGAPFFPARDSNLSWSLRRPQLAILFRSLKVCQYAITMSIGKHLLGQKHIQSVAHERRKVECDLETERSMEGYGGRKCPLCKEEEHFMFMVPCILKISYK